MKNSVYELAAEADRIFREAVFQAQEDLKSKNIPLVYVNRDSKLCWQISDDKIVCRKPRSGKFKISE
ncbi:hypothetical protein [Seleniivibrio woodruffii]|uniref:Uncharacterized protein n=1 Tax=Seleniivibrio woodruffii TaxID=1078050 RepID=A0A4V2PRT2_9BACT|nr:hypothetical protein [Seleniivibrio woodruffii]TCK60021.1 hypothetical protein C8D98_2193 [Seleniivibrio woodruffii]TVZ35758.1 hypothetical protein OF66_1374 [Seleniivibrio woodruffii]